MNFKLNSLRLLFACALGLVSVLSFADPIDVRFNNPTCPSGTQYCITAQVKAGSGTNVKLGNSTIFFSYNTAAISSPTVQTIHNFGTADGYGYQPQFGTYQSGSLGEGNYNIIFGNTADAGNTITEVLSTTTWTDVATFCFTVVSSATNKNLTIVTTAGYTGFNKSVPNTSADEHTLGTITNSTTPTGTDCTIVPTGKVVALKALLEGCYNGTSLTTSLSTAPSLLPTAQPYNVAPWNYAGTETFSTIPTGMTDWVYVEAATLSGNTFTIVERHAAILKSNGDIVDAPSVSGASTTGVTFNSLTTGSPYYFIVKHRNHIGIVTPASLTAASSMIYDFTTTNATITLGAATYIQQKSVAGGKFALFAGNPSGDSNVNALDYPLWKLANPTTGQYRKEDLDLNRNVNALDYPKWKLNNPKTGVSLPN